MISSWVLFLAIAVTSQQSVDPAKLVGMWEVVKGKQPPVGSTLEFTKDGKFKTSIKGQTITFEGNYKFEGDQLTLTPPGSAMSVRELTNDKLVVEGNGNAMEYKRMEAAAAAMPKAVQRSGGFSLGAQPKGKGVGGGAGAGKWVVVKSEKDGFTVEMPGQPNGHENEFGGGFEINSMSYQTPTSEYIVMAVHGPTEVPKAEEAKAMERIRAKAASKIGTGFTLISEDPAQLGTIEGVAFQFAVEKAAVKNLEGIGRCFIKGKIVYIILAVNQKVPEDTYKFVNSFALTDSSAGNPATAKGRMPKSPARKADVGKADATPPKTWGTEVDPDGDVKITASGQSLTMQVPGTPHVLAPERDKMNAPRVIAPAHEDFVVSVQVDGAFQPSDKSTVKGLSSRQAAGLILWKDSKNYLVFQRRASVGDEGKDTNQAVLEELVGGNKGVMHRPAAPEGPLFLRLERNRGKITAAFSRDGKDWKDLKPVDTTWADGEVQVGVVAVNTSTGPHKVMFKEYSLKEK